MVILILLRNTMFKEIRVKAVLFGMTHVHTFDNFLLCWVSLTQSDERILE